VATVTLVKKKVEKEVEGKRGKRGEEEVEGRKKARV